MRIAFPCRRCGTTLHADDRHAGRAGRCKACGCATVVPGAPTASVFVPAARKWKPPGWLLTGLLGVLSAAVLVSTGVGLTTLLRPKPGAPGKRTPLAVVEVTPGGLEVFAPGEPGAFPGPVRVGDVVEVTSAFRGTRVVFAATWEEAERMAGRVNPANVGYDLQSLDDGEVGGIGVPARLLVIEPPLSPSGADRGVVAARDDAGRRGWLVHRHVGLTTVARPASSRVTPEDLAFARTRAPAVPIDWTKAFPPPAPYRPPVFLPSMRSPDVPMPGVIRKP